MSTGLSGRSWAGWAGGAVAVSLSVFQLYTAGFGTLSAMFQRGIHLGLALALVFLLWPLGGGRRGPLARAVDLALVGLSFATAGYLLVFYDEIIWRIGDATGWDIALGTVATLLVLEACRRTTGWVMTFIAAVFLGYAFWGNHLPGALSHKGYNLERVMTQLYLTTEGIYGSPLAVAATFVFIFVLFGAFLEVTGAGQFFIDLAYALTGRYRGGPAKTAVLASALVGSVSGSAIANTVATGTFTIPLMKRLGYAPHEAGGIEAAASTGGQMMPPIMGAGAFLMAEYTGLPYWQIVKVSFIPAMMYFYTVLLFVHVWAVKKGLKGAPADELPRMGATFRAGAHFLLPFAVLLYFLYANYSPMMVGFVSVISIFAAALLRRATRIGVVKTLEALEAGAKQAVS
ncbi:MAG: TRAP transporter permease, partial [Deferrisomatales bacterium]